ncbi:PAS domain S-box protein [Haloarcula nitratireducens]|uniref:histidine kinase n=1 Tax=Haloarcula nitratireducens TaxID=2487749 RepID=A0AAW4PCK3_9EURY|nr:PAS domain S-box protein [Halomicroarcula nitratireducens]MBX0295644.1 PAS domain S-box protein [Halomicroarcula nitratireducens]
MDSPSETDAGVADHVRRQEVVADIGQLALETDDLDRLLRDASDAIAETLHAEYSGVFELQSTEDALRLWDGAGWPADCIGTATAPVESGLQTGYTLRDGGPVLVEDYRSDDRFATAELLDERGVRSGITAIIGSVEEPWGVLGVYSTTAGHFTDPDISFVQNVSNVLTSTVENRRTRRRLEAEKLLKSQIIETSPVGIVIVGAGGTIEFANDRAVEIYDRSRDELESFSHDDLRWDLVDTDGTPLPAEELPFNKVLESGEPIFDMEVGLRKPDGQRIWVSVNGSPLETDDDDDDGGRAVFTFTDITDRLRLEGEFEEILTRITDAFYALDEEFRFTHVNARAEELLQHSEEELVGETLWDVFPSAAEIDEVWDAFHTARDEQKPTSYELYYDTLDFWVEANLYPSESGISVYFRDISDRVKRERKLEETIEELEQSNEQLESFASMLAHEIRNPVTIGQIYSQQLSTDENPQAVEYVEEAFDRIEEMVDIMLLLTRGDGATGDRGPVSLADVARDAWADVEACGATLSVDVDDEVAADETYVRHLFRNLFENAITHGGDDVDVRVERLSNGFSVADDGVGVPEADRERVFEEGYTTTGDGQGTGLGLAFVREVADVYGWECQLAESDAGGARIEFRGVEFLGE